MSIDSDRWTIAVRKYGQCAPWSFSATMEHADMDLTGLEGTLMCSMVGQNDHGARIETFPGPTPTCSERPNSRRKEFELKTCVSEEITNSTLTAMPAWQTMQASLFNTLLFKQLSSTQNYRPRARVRAAGSGSAPRKRR